MKQLTKTILCLLLTVLLAAAALTGCTQPTTPATEAPKTEAPATEAPKTEAAPQTTEAAPQTTEAQPVRETVSAIGQGEKLFHLKVTFPEGEVALYDVHTDAETVGAALAALDLIAGEGGFYDTVCGKTLSWEADHMYWAFYIGEDYAMTGLDDTPIDPDGSYALAATAG